MTTAVPPVPVRPDLGVPSVERASVRSSGRSLLLLRAAGVALVVLLAAYLGISYKYADTLSRVERRAPSRPATVVAATYEPVAFVAADGIRLRGWWFPAAAPRVRAAVLVHGKDQNRIDSAFDGARIGRILLDRGYSVLLFDLRGHGESEGQRWGLGKQEAQGS